MTDTTILALPAVVAVNPGDALPTDQTDGVTRKITVGQIAAGVAAGLATVASSGSYADLANLPTSTTITGALPAGNNTIGRASLPVGTGAAASGATTIAQASTYQTLFAAGSITNGAFVQNPASNTSVLSIDITGATGGTLLSTSEDLAPGQSWSTAFSPTNAITVLSPALIQFRAGRF